MDIDVTKLQPQSIAISRIERCPHCGAILGLHQRSPFKMKEENDVRYDVLSNDYLVGGYVFSYRCRQCKAVIHKTYAMSNTKLRKKYKRYKQYEGSSFSWDWGTTYYYSKQTMVKRKMKYDLALYEAVMEIPTANGMDTYKFDIENDCWFYDGLYTEGLPFENTRPRPKYAYRKLQIFAFLFAFLLVYGVANFSHHEVVYPAEVNTKYTGHNRGGSWEYKYEFSIDKPGIVTPEEDTLGIGLSARNGLYLMKADGTKDVIHQKWIDNSPKSIYLEKGKYIVLTTPGDALDYSRKGYWVRIGYEPASVSKPEKNLQVGKVYKDKLSSAEDVNVYKFKTVPKATLIFQTNKPASRYTGKTTLFDNHSKSTENKDSLFEIVIENEEGEVVDTIDDISSNYEIFVSPEKEQTYTIKVSAVNYSPDEYTFFIITE